MSNVLNSCNCWSQC